MGRLIISFVSAFDRRIICMHFNIVDGIHVCINAISVAEHGYLMRNLFHAEGGPFHMTATASDQMWKIAR